MIESKETQIQEIEAKEPSVEAIEGELMKLQCESPVQEDEGVSLNIQCLGDQCEGENLGETTENTSLAASAIEAFKKELETSESPEEKLSKTIEMMAASLAQTGNPDFKVFWESRKLCLDLFKENIPPAVKALHWSKYRELTKEAKRLKEIFEEQSAFAIEQIEIAIKALETDIGTFTEQLEKIEFPDLPLDLRALQNNRDTYLAVQRELNLLNAQAARINALRKELIKTEMRIRQKNKFFQRLSAAGDHVFPRRKELIKEISQLFITDVSDYIRNHFTGLSQEKSLHNFREEIKALQSVAKLMTLNTNAFTQTRLKLSECWDKLKVVEKERRTVQAQQKQTFKENADSVREKIKEFSALVESNKTTSNEAQKKFDELNKFMRGKELGRDDVRVLKDELNNAYKPLKNKMLAEEKKRREIELETEQNRQQKVKEVEDRIAKFSEELTSKTPSEASREIATIENDIQELDLTEFERDGLVRQLVPLLDDLESQSIEAILDLPNQDSDKKSKVVAQLQKATKRRNEIKEQIEKYRKACSGSGLDFEQSMYFNEQLSVEKDRFEKATGWVDRLESELVKLKKK